MASSSLSVLLTSFNYGRFIGRALSAMVAQSQQPMEIIVVDDASTDDSLEVVERFARGHVGVRVLRNERNLGTLRSMARGMEILSGDYIFNAAADDFVLPGFFEQSMSMLERYPEAGLCCSDPMYFESATGDLRPTPLRLSPVPRYFALTDVAWALSSRNAGIYGHATIYKRSALRDAGDFIPELRWHCDWFASLVIAFRHGICYIPEFLAAMRYHTDSYSAAGPRDWSVQRTVFVHMLDLLVSPAYRDVLPMFRESLVLGSFGLPLLRVLSEHPARGDFLTVALIRRAIWGQCLNSLRCSVAGVTPRRVKHAYRRFRFGQLAAGTISTFSSSVGPRH